MIQHVIPLNDTQEHSCISEVTELFEPFCVCECSPRCEVIDLEHFIFIHNSFDGREGVEWVNELLT